MKRSDAFCEGLHGRQHGKQLMLRRLCRMPMDLVTYLVKGLKFRFRRPNIDRSNSIIRCITPVINLKSRDKSCQILLIPALLCEEQHLICNEIVIL